MQKVVNTLKDIFNKDPRQKDNFLKVNAKKIDSLQINKLNELKQNFYHLINEIEVKRSGAGLVIVVELKTNI